MNELLKEKYNKLYIDINNINDFVVESSDMFEDLLVLFNDVFLINGEIGFKNDIMVIQKIFDELIENIKDLLVTINSNI